MQRSASSFHFGGGYAGGRHDVDAEGVILGHLQHVTNAFQTQHVGDFVGIGDDGCGTARHHSPGKLVWRDHRAFDVHVGIYKARADIASTQIYHFACLIVTQAHNT